MPVQSTSVHAGASAAQLRWTALFAATATGVGIGALAAAPRNLALSILAATLAVGLLLPVAWRRPDLGMMALLAGVPYFPLLFAQLLAAGVTPAALGALRFWKEALLGVLAARAATARPRTSPIDWVALGYLCLVTMYILAPYGPNPPFVRMIAGREIAGFVVIFLVARHLPLAETSQNRIENIVLVSAAVLAGLGLWNALDPASWNQWVESTRLNEYRLLFADASTIGRSVVTAEVAGQEVIRAGSLLGYLSLPYYLAIGLSVVLARVVHGRAGVILGSLGALFTAGILATLSRSAIALAPLAVLLSVGLGPRRGRLAAALLMATLALAPLAATLPLSDHLESALDQNNPSTADHVRKLSESRGRIWSSPLGSGLGTSAQSAQRFNVEGGITNESWYFQIGTDIGWAGFAAYVALLILVLRALLTATRDGSPHALGALCALIWIALGGIVLHTLNDLSVAWSVWAIVGMATRRLGLSGSSSDYERLDERTHTPTHQLNVEHALNTAPPRQTLAHRE